MSEPLVVVLDGGHGFVVLPEASALLARQLDAALAALCRPVAGAPRPTPPRPLVTVLEAARAVAAAQAARTHADVRRWTAPTPMLGANVTDGARSASMLTTAQAAELTGRSAEYWRVRAAAGRVPARKIGTSWLIEVAAVESTPYRPSKERRT